MFGNLIIQLPSNYTGGQLTVRYRSKSKIFDFGGPAALSNFYAAAFYSGCHCEVKPIKEGYCLYLLYDLVYSGSGSCPGPSAPQHEPEVSAIAALMKEWNESDESTNCSSLMVYTLEKRYSAEANLTFKSLSNKLDKAVATVLTRAQKIFGFDLYVARICIDDKWLAAEEDDVYDFDSYSRNLEVVDPLGHDASATNLVSVDGECIDSIAFDPKCITDYDDVCLGEETPDEEVVTDSDEVTLSGDPMYNLTNKYYKTALLFWPNKNRFKNLGVKNIIHLLNKDLQDQSSPSQIRGLETRAKELIDKCVLPYYRDQMTAELYVLLLQNLLVFDKVELISDFLHNVASSDLCYGSLIDSSSFGKEIVTVGNKYGWDIVKSPLEAIFDKVPSTDGSKIMKCCQLLHSISLKSISEAQKKVCRGLAGSVVRVLLEQDERKLMPSDSPIYSTFREPAPFCPDKDFLLLLLQCLEEIGGEEQLATLIQDFAKKPLNYPISWKLIHVCESLHKSRIEGEGNGNALQQLLFFCISTLEKISNSESWSKGYAFTCKCESCQKLIGFLHSEEEQHVFEVDENKRMHMLHQLQWYGCLSKVSTECTEDNRSLVVTKKHAKIGLSEYEQETLSRLLSIRATSGLGAYAPSSSDDGEQLAKKFKIEPEQ